MKKVHLPVTIELAIANMDNSLKLYDIGNSCSLCIADSNTVKVHKVDFSPEGSKVLCGTTSICLINVGDGSLMKEFANDSKFITCLRYSPSGNLIAVGNIDGSLLFYKTDTYSRIAKTDDHGLSLRDFVFSPDGKFVVSVSDDMHINVTDL